MCVGSCESLVHNAPPTPVHLQSLLSVFCFFSFVLLFLGTGLTTTDLWYLITTRIKTREEDYKYRTWGVIKKNTLI